MQHQSAFSFNFDNLCDGGTSRKNVTYQKHHQEDSYKDICLSINTDEIIRKKIKNREKLELNELPKSILVEILKHLNDDYSSCVTVKPQNPFFHNYCYSDQMTNGRDGKDNRGSGGKKSKSEKNNDQQLPNSLNSTKNYQESNSTIKTTTTTTATTTTSCIYIKDIINLSLVCKLWAKCVVPCSISRFIKVSNKRELLTYQRFMKEGIIPGGYPCHFTTIKFHSSCKMGNSVLSMLSNNGTMLPVCNVNPITSCDYKQFLESCTNIKSLCFGTGALNLESISEIMCYLKKSSNITELKINTNFCSQSFKVFCEALKVNQSITYLDISNNPLTRDNIQMLVEVLKCNRSLNYLDLSFNDIGVNGSLLAEFIKVNTSIQSLFLIGNQLDNDSVTAISDALRNKNSSITEISLSENDFDDDAGSVIGEIFLNNKSLKTIDLSFNGLGESTVQGFSEALLCGGAADSFSCLESINLSDCSFSENEESGIQFFRALQMNRKLKALVLWSCDLRSQRVKEELAMALKNNTTLQEISLGFNELTSDDISILVQRGLKYNKSLKVISFNNNYISTVGGIIIAEYLKHSDTVKEISLFDNCLDNCAAVEFMNTLCSNHNIRKLCLGSNRICPNLSNIFRKLLQYNRSTPSPSPYNNTRQQWISTKLHFLKSELTNLNLKFDQQTQLSNSMRELFKVLNLNCANISQQQQLNQQLQTQRANTFLNLNFMGQCKISSPPQKTTTSTNQSQLVSPQQHQQQQHSQQQYLFPQQQQQQKQPVTICQSSSSIIASTNSLWHPQQSLNLSQPNFLLTTPPLQQQQQPLTPQKPIFQQPLFQYNNNNNNMNIPPTTTTLTNNSNLFPQPQSIQHQSNLLSPITTGNIQQPNNIYQQNNNNERIVRQFEDELIQLQSQLQLDLNNSNQFLNNNTPFNTFF